MSLLTNTFAMRFLSHRLKAFFQRSPALIVSPLMTTLPSGFFLPQTGTLLAAAPNRAIHLQQLWENSPLPAAQYADFCLEPLKALLERVQNVPATSEGTWSHEGGFADLTLDFTTCVVRLAKGYMFPPDAPPEVQSAQGTLWQVVIFWAALTYHLPLLAHLEGEHEDGSIWQPGLTVPRMPFRFRFSKTLSQDTHASALASLMAGQLLPTEMLNWITGTPAALNNLATAMGYRCALMPLIQTLFQQAAEKVDSPFAKKQEDTLPVVDSTKKTTTSVQAGMNPSAEPDFILTPTVTHTSTLSTPTTEEL